MKDPAFLFYPADFLGGVSGLTMEERGQYITLLCIQHQRGSINTKRVGLILGLEWVSLSSELRAKFVVDENGDARNTRLSNEIERRTNFIERQRINGKKGGRPKTQPLTQTKPKQNPNHNPNHNPNETLSKLENINVNEIEDRDEIEEKGGTGEKESSKRIEPMIVDTDLCRVYGDEWRKDFGAYKAGLRQCYNSLRKNAEWLAERKRLNPGVDILLTLEKCCVEFWATEAGWDNKKSKRTKMIDWKQTMTSAVSQKQNKVYENVARNNQNSAREAKQASLDSLVEAAHRCLRGDQG